MSAYEMIVWVVGLVCAALTADTLIRALFNIATKNDYDEPPRDCNCDDCGKKERPEDIE